MLTARAARAQAAAAACALLVLSAAPAIGEETSSPAPGFPPPARRRRPVPFPGRCDPQLSPDGRWIAYTVTTMDREDDASTTRIWMAPASGGGAAIPMTNAERSSVNAALEPGRALSRLHRQGRRRRKEQVWTLFREGGEAVQRTETVQGVSGFEWAPDSRRLALVLEDPTAATPHAPPATRTRARRRRRRTSSRDGSSSATTSATSTAAAITSMSSTSRRKRCSSSRRATTTTAIPRGRRTDAISPSRAIARRTRTRTRTPTSGA